MSTGFFQPRRGDTGCVAPSGLAYLTTSIGPRAHALGYDASPLRGSITITARKKAIYLPVTFRNSIRNGWPSTLTSARCASPSIGPVTHFVASVSAAM